MTGRLIKYMALVLISVFILAIVWEFKIEATVLPLLGISEIEESAATHWRFVVASTGFTILAMIIPFFLLYKSDVQRSAVQNSLIESERFRRELINCPPESIFMIDNEGVVLVANEYGARGLGLAPGDVIGKNIFEVVPPEVANERLGYLRRILKRPETTITTDFRDGQWFETIAEPHLNEIGEVERISLFARNITERKLAELAMQDSEKSLRAFIDATIDYAALVDSDGTFRIANQPMAHKYGLTKEELIGRPMFSRPLSETGRRRKQWLDDVLNTGRAIRETDEQDGRWYDSSYYPVIAGDGKVTQVAVFARDITEQKIVENELTAAKASSESANRAKSEFLSSVSHELRTPLNAIMGFGQLLEIDSKEPLSERQLAYTQQILNGGEHLIELIDQVLELSKIEAGKFSLSIEKVDPTNVVGECLNMVKERARENDVTLVDLTNEANLPILWVDKSRFIQVLLNLLSNAIKYNRRAGSVTITSELAGDGFQRFSVVDTGKGIAKDKQGRLFEPFNRLGLEAGEIEGTGIGLTITKKIMNLLGGRIGYESEENVGSTFWVEFPISEDQSLTHGDAIEAIGSVEIGEIPDNQCRTLLYIEDNSPNLSLMKEVIGNIPNLTMLSAPDAEAGLDIAKSQMPDLILMDINLPGIDGVEALEKLRSNKKTKIIPVIAITAAAMTHEIERGHQAGFEEYITKPFKIPEVLATVEKYLK